METTCCSYKLNKKCYSFTYLYSYHIIFKTALILQHLSLTEVYVMILQLITQNFYVIKSRLKCLRGRLPKPFAGGQKPYYNKFPLEFRAFTGNAHRCF